MIWEYKVIPWSAEISFREYELNELGRRGWELVQIAETHAVLKREKGAPR
jgi:hypothetical protein